MRSFLCLMLCGLRLSGEDVDLPLYDVKNGSPMLVGGVVNVITGEFVDGGLDLKVFGPSQLSFERGYSSGDRHVEGLFRGWRHNHLGCAKVFNRGEEILYEGGFSSPLFFKDNKPQPNKKQTNLGARMCGRSAYLNTRITHTSQHIKVKRPSGVSQELTSIGQGILEEDTFMEKDLLQKLRLIKTPYEGFRAIKTKFLNGAEFSYQYMPSGLLSEIISSNRDGTEVFGKISFDVKENAYIAKGSDGQEVYYSLISRDGGGDDPCKLIGGVYPTNAPWTKYTYLENKRVITGKRRPEGRLLLIEYEEPSFRVSRLRSPSGVDALPKITHEFQYRKGGKEGVSFTEVTDGNKNLTVYEMHRGKLSTITTFGKKKAPLYTEQFAFDEDGQLTEQILTDKNGKEKAKHSFSYDYRGNIVYERISGNIKGDGGALAKRFAYSENNLNLLTVETNGMGLKTKYKYFENTDLIEAKFLVHKGKIVMRTFFSYDKNGCLTRVVRDDGSSKNQETMSDVTERAIQVFTLRQEAPFGLPEVQQDLSLNLVTGEEICLLKKVLTYDKRGLVLKEAFYNGRGVFQFEKAFSYDAHGNVTREVDPLGREIFRKYDKNDNLIEESASHKSYVKRFCYDLMNRKVREEIESPHQTISTGFAYDLMGHLVQTSDSCGRVTNFVNDHRGKPIQIIDSKGCKETFCYDVFGFPIVKWDACHLKTETKMTLFGKPYHVIFPDGREETMRYDLLGNLVFKKTADGVTIHYSYDFLGRLVREEHCDGEKVVRFRTWDYNAFHLLSETDFEGIVTNYTYDFAGRVISKARGDEVTDISYDDLGRESVIVKSDLTHKKQYDFLDRIVEEEWSNGLLKRYEYDGDDNIIKEVTQSDEGVKEIVTRFDFLKRPLLKVDEEGYKTTFEYQHGVINEQGEVVLRTIITDPKGGKVISDQNGFNEVCRLEKRSLFGQLLSLQEKEFFQNGLTMSVKDFVVVNAQIIRSIDTHYTYENGQLIRVIEGAKSNTQKVTAFKYNTLGQKWMTVKPDGTILLSTFDCFGRLLTLYSSNGEIAYEYTYDKSDRVTEVKNGGFFTKRTYGLRGEVVNEVFETGDTLSFGYDTLLRLKSVIYPDKSAVDYSYGEKGLKSVKRISSQHEYQIDVDVTSQGLPKKILFPEKGGTLQFTYDEKGRARHLTHESLSLNIPAKGFDERGNLLILDHQTPGILEQFTYDDLDHLVEDGSSYTYDSLDNRVKKDGMSYLYNALNQRDDFSYDLNGNLLFDGERCYAYDALDRLVRVEGKGGVDLYRYDPFNRLLTHNKKQFFYGHSCVLGFQEGDDVVCRVLSTLKREIGTTLSIERGSDYFLALPDLFGSVTALINPKSGVCIEKVSYKSFGEGRLDLSPFGYQGKYTVGPLLFFGERVYHTSLGRFLTCDPSGFADGPNLYAYTHNNPLKNCDHFGLSSIGRYATFLFFSLFNTVGISYSTDGTNHHVAPFTGPCSLFGPPRELSQVSIERAPLSAPSKQPHKLVTFVNGVSTDEETQGQNQLFLSDLVGTEEFVPIHHDTNLDEGILDDALRYVSYRLTGGLSNASKALIATWEGHLRQYPETGEILHICHSEGALHTKYALQAMPLEMKSKINVVVIAGAAYISRKDCAKVWHYVSPRDLVPWLDPAGRRQAQIENSLHVLPVNQQAPWFDHAFLSPTYDKSMRISVKNFLN